MVHIFPKNIPHDDVIPSIWKFISFHVAPGPIFQKLEKLVFTSSKSDFYKNLRHTWGIQAIVMCSLGGKCQILRFSKIQNVGVA